MNVPTEHEVTGEMNARLRVVVVVLDENKYAILDGDARAWDMIERIAVGANLNVFGDPNAGPATKVQFKRLSQPVLRREGVTIGVVEWESDLTIGTNKARNRDQVWFNGQQVTQTPTNITVQGHVQNQSGDAVDETSDASPEE